MMMMDSISSPMRHSASVAATLVQALKTQMIIPIVSNHFKMEAVTKARFLVLIIQGTASNLENRSVIEPPLTTHKLMSARLIMMQANKWHTITKASCTTKHQEHKA